MNDTCGYLRECYIGREHDIDHRGIQGQFVSMRELETFDVSGIRTSAPVHAAGKHLVMDCRLRMSTQDTMFRYPLSFVG